MRPFLLQRSQSWAMSWDTALEGESVLFPVEATFGCPGVRCITWWGKTSIRFCAYRGLPQRPDQVVFFVPRVQRQYIFAEDMGLSIRARKRNESWGKKTGIWNKMGSRCRSNRRFRPIYSWEQAGSASKRGEFCSAQPGLAMGEVCGCRNLPFQSPSSPLPACSLRSRLNTHARSRFPVPLAKCLCLVFLLSRLQLCEVFPVLPLPLLSLEYHPQTSLQQLSHCCNYFKCLSAANLRAPWGKGHILFIFPPLAWGLT